MKQSLNFNWSFVDHFEESFLKALPNYKVKIDIPHNAVNVPYNYFSELDYQKIFTYEKFFDVEDDLDNKVFILHFAGYMVKGHIYLNDHDLGVHGSTYLPVDLDVTSYLTKKNNRLLVIIDGQEDEDYPPFGFAIDYLTFAGIYREVELYSHPKTYLKDIFVRGKMDGTISIQYEVMGNAKAKITHTVYYKGSVAAEFNGQNYLLKDHRLWDINKPRLYTLKTTIVSSDGEEDYYTDFGFREAVFKQDGFYLNGNKIKLVGLNRHQGYPFVGYAMPQSMQEEDVDILKYELGVNVVRTSHYPQSEHFLNRCDQIGLLVVNEIPGWQFVSKKETWRNNFLENIKKMVITERNHPSLIAHGVRIDESIDDHELYSAANKLAHEFDPYRQTLGVRNFKNSELLEDIYAYNDFICRDLKAGLENPKHIKHQNKPYLVTEYMGHMDPLKATSDILTKIEVSKRHMKVMDDNYKYQNIAGAIGWCFVDYHTHVDFGSGDHICPHGVMDIYRNPKFSSYIYASQREDAPVLEVLSNIKPGDIPEAVYGDIYIATNCDYVALYKNDEFVGNFYPNKKEYKYVKHPLILIDNLVGETFKEERFKQKHWDRMGKTFSYYAIHGLNKMKLKDSLFLARMMLTYRMNYSDLVYYWNKHVASWGGIAKKWTFKGYKDGKIVKELDIGPSKSFDLKIKANRDYLEPKDTYDVLRIQLSHVDEYQSLMLYSNRVINIQVEGPISLIGDENQALLGGQLSIYIRSNGKGQGRVTFKMDNIVKTFDVEVK